MQLTGRIFLGAIIFALTFWLVSSLFFPLLAFGTPRPFRITIGLACAALVTVPVWRASADPAPGLGTSMLKGAGLLGGIGFIGGYAGPMVLAPDANQGPLLGIFITGPAGFLIGAIAGAIWWKQC
jgi:hypothetical protein